MSPPRAGTFIYHTQAGELAQLTGGLYRAMIVRPSRTAPDPDDRVIVLGDSTTDSLRGRTPVSMINGRSAPAPIVLRAGTTHRLRFVSIGAVTQKRLRLLDADSAGRTLHWTPRREGELVLEVTSDYGPAVVTPVRVVVKPGNK